MGPYVLLLREPSSPPETDRYVDALSRASFRPLSLPVLETVLENLESLSRIFRGSDDQCTLDGVIVTSARAVDACAHAGADIDWGKVRFYVVGPATAAQLARLPHPPHDVRGTESGTAERLAHYVVQDAKRGERLLYLTGDKNRDTLPRVVREGLGGEEVLQELRVYATRGVENIEHKLARALEGVTDDDCEPWWIVFFAPSSAAHVTPALRVHFSLAMGETSNIITEEKNRIRRARVAAIGRTTGEYLGDEAGVRVEVVPDTPSAESLTLALVKAPK
ncbi:tetrapyrrole biosynthesis, uroporphyrinogen III synthase [Lactarius vividus]|nr:tetrapyrrole biosynthesis, uroporphyrinogen III synthase [Lactarius vividus]